MDRSSAELFKAGRMYRIRVADTFETDAVYVYSSEDPENQFSFRLLDLCGVWDGRCTGIDNIEVLAIYPLL